MKTKQTTISNANCKKAIQHCTAISPELVNLFSEIGDLNFKPSGRDLHEALIRSVTSQMISTAAANTITRKLIARAYNVSIESLPVPAVFPQLSQLATLSHDDLRAVGYSNAKALAIREIGEKAITGELPTRQGLDKLSDDEIIKLLVPLRGIGKWTVEMFLIFTLGRSDVWPVDDFGVREGFRLWHGDTQQSTPKQLRGWAEPFAPYRSILALYFWKWADRNKVKKSSLLTQKY